MHNLWPFRRTIAMYNTGELYEYRHSMHQFAAKKLHEKRVCEGSPKMKQFSKKGKVLPITVEQTPAILFLVYLCLCAHRSIL